MANALSMGTIHQIAEPSVLDGNQTRIVTKTGTWQVTYIRVGADWFLSHLLSFGGNWKQNFNVKTEWRCDE